MADHGYCEGKQHLRRNRYRLASFHTSVFFLQTAAAAKASPVTQQACDELQRAFALKQEGDGSSGSGNTDADAGSKSREPQVTATPTAGSAPVLESGSGLSLGGSEDVAAVNHAADVDDDKAGDDGILQSKLTGLVEVDVGPRREGGVMGGDISSKSSRKEKGGGGGGGAIEAITKRGKGKKRRHGGVVLDGIAVGAVVAAKTGAGAVAVAVGRGDEDERLPEAPSGKKKSRSMAEKKQRAITAAGISEGGDGRPPVKRPKKGKSLRTEGKKAKKGKGGTAC